MVALYGMNMGPINIQTNGEEALIEKLALRLPSDAVLFDVGANKGDYTLALLRHTGADVRIFTFEPGARAFKQLSGSVSSAPNVRLERIGFGDRTGTVDLFADAEGSVLASVYPRRVFGSGAMRDRLAERIEIMRIDDFCHANGIGRINLLKLDVEGHELSVLHGCGDLLAQDFFDLLTPKYTIFRMVADGLVPIKAYRESYEIFDTNNYVAARDVSLLSGMY
jgi:FkbM family methyltransferase